MVAHPDVDMVSFTGGISTGRSVLAACASRLRPAVLELGGNDPAIVGPDWSRPRSWPTRLLEAAVRTLARCAWRIKPALCAGRPSPGWREALDGEDVVRVVGDGLDDRVTMDRCTRGRRTGSRP